MASTDTQSNATQDTTLVPSSASSTAHDGGIVPQRSPGAFDGATGESHIPGRLQNLTRGLKLSIPDTVQSSSPLGRSPSGGEDDHDSTPITPSPEPVWSPKSSESNYAPLSSPGFDAGFDLDAKWDAHTLPTGPSELAKSTKERPLKSCLKKTRDTRTITATQKDVEPWNLEGEATASMTKSVMWAEEPLSKADREWYLSRNPKEKLTGMDFTKDNRGNSRMVDPAYRHRLGVEREGDNLKSLYAPGILAIRAAELAFEDAFPLLSKHGVDLDPSTGLSSLDPAIRSAWRNEKNTFRREHMVRADDPSYQHLATAFTSQEANDNDDMDLGNWMLEYDKFAKRNSSMIFTRAQKAAVQDRLDTLPTTSRRLTKDELHVEKVFETCTTNRKGQATMLRFDPIYPLTMEQAADQNLFGLSSKDGVVSFDNGTHILRTEKGEYAGNLATLDGLREHGYHSMVSDPLMAAEHALWKEQISQDAYKKYTMDRATLHDNKTQIVLTNAEKAERDSRLAAYEKEGVALHGERPGCTSCTRSWCQSVHHTPSKMLSAMIKHQKGLNSDGTKKRAFNMKFEGPSDYWDEVEPTEEGKRWNSRTYTEWLESIQPSTPTSVSISTTPSITPKPPGLTEAGRAHMRDVIQRFSEAWAPPQLEATSKTIPTLCAPEQRGDYIGAGAIGFGAGSMIMA